MKTIFTLLAIFYLAVSASAQNITLLTPLGAAPDPTNDLMYVWDQSVGAGGANGGMKSMTPANLFTSPALTTPNIGTPSAGTLTSCTGLPIATGVSGLGSGVATFLATPSGANLASALTTALPASKGGTGLTALSANVVTLLGAADFAAFRSSLGLDTGDSPTFNGLTLTTATVTTTNTTNFQIGGEAVTSNAAELNVLDGIPGTLTATELGYVDGVTSAIQTQLDAKAAKAVVTKSTATNYTVGTTDANEFYGGVIYVTGACTITVPAVAAGASFTVATDGAVAVSVDVDASDKIYLNGTALSDGDKITNASTSGDMAVFVYRDGTGWWVTTNDGWTDTN